MLNICITADHELFFGRNFVSAEEVFIRPTYSLINVLRNYRIPLCLMTDVCSILRYRELNIEYPYVDLMEEQLRYAVREGNDVQLHLHPHWLDSEYAQGQWMFSYEKYRLHNFSFDESAKPNVRQIIAEGKKYLEDLLKPVDETYECRAFRAGGWCIQPEKELLTALAAEGIVIDTTVYYGGYYEAKNSCYNFRRVPNKPNWWINPQKGLEYEDCKQKGNILEAAIGSYGFWPLLGWKKLKYLSYRRKLEVQMPKVRGLSMDQIGPRSYRQVIAEKVKHFIFHPVMFTFDAACYVVMMDILNYYLKHFDCLGQDFYLCMIGHPKTLTEAYLEQIDKFCAKVTTEYSDRVKFIRLLDIPL